ncbi:MAG: type II toxin-antitoxin system Phd/YefM family antitoxin [Pseudomonadota bacterium]
MKKISISKFKAECLALIDQVDKTREPLVVTKFGRPIAEVVPITKTQDTSWLGSMQDQGQIVGDLLDTDSAADWEAITE